MLNKPELDGTRKRENQRLFIDALKEVQNSHYKVHPSNMIKAVHKKRKLIDDIEALRNQFSVSCSFASKQMTPQISTQRYRHYVQTRYNTQRKPGRSLLEREEWRKIYEALRRQCYLLLY